MKIFWACNSAIPKSHGAITNKKDLIHLVKERFRCAFDKDGRLNQSNPFLIDIGPVTVESDDFQLVLQKK